MSAKTQAAGSSSRGVYQPDSDVHITYDDQLKINTFAKYIAKIKDLNEDLAAKKNELKTLEEASEEIELFDEDEQIPYLIGEVFISHNLTKTQELLAAAKEEKQAEIKGIQDRCKDLEDETGNLKAQLYQRFGNNIYLEADE